MIDLKNIKLDLVFVVVLLAVMVGGFWMTGSAMDERVDALDQKVQVTDQKLTGLMNEVADIHKDVILVRKAIADQASKVAAPVAAPAPAPAAKPAKSK